MSGPADTVRPLLRVRQTRAFTDEPVDSDQLDAIADAARWSGSNQNRQPWRFIVLRERATLDAVAAAARQDSGALVEATAAIAIVLPVEPKRSIALAFDEGRAAERILVAATLLGLGAGITWVGSDERPAVGRVLGLPDDHAVRTIVALGHPTEPAGDRSPSARLPREETVFAERWPG